jgi:hypothetical protein
LLPDQRVVLGRAVDLSEGLAGDHATPQLDANAGASIGGSIENAGLINVGANRLATSGGYRSSNGTALGEFGREHPPVSLSLPTVRENGLEPLHAGGESTLRLFPIPRALLCT